MLAKDAHYGYTNPDIDFDHTTQVISKSQLAIQQTKPRRGQRVNLLLLILRKQSIPSVVLHRIEGPVSHVRNRERKT